jgi:hypothetical protein
VDINQLTGWTDKQVVAALGKPDEKTDGRSWPAPELFGPPVMLTSSGEVMQSHVFGPGLPQIPAFTPYQTWMYYNVDGSNWVLYLTPPGAQPVPPPGLATGRAERKGIWDRIQGLFGGGANGRLWSGWQKAYHPKGPLVVAYVTSYPVGAVF